MKSSKSIIDVFYELLHDSKLQFLFCPIEKAHVVKQHLIDELQSFLLIHDIASNRRRNKHWRLPKIITPQIEEVVVEEKIKVEVEETTIMVTKIINYEEVVVTKIITAKEEDKEAIILHLEQSQ